MRRLVLVGVLWSGAAIAAPAEVILATPASISLSAWCKSTACSQPTADQAQAHCERYRRSAKLESSTVVERTFFEGEKVVFRFSCVP